PTPTAVTEIQFMPPISAKPMPGSAPGKRRSQVCRRRAQIRVAAASRTMVTPAGMRQCRARRARMVHHVAPAAATIRAAAFNRDRP
ncbi:MAG TPA: hypothetical protein VN153_01490, partial [Tahibacter sp.]|nr:hypothetical protein [Tahibacter sp.]